ncbi:S-adenosyl-L-methionine-dependent methyltransferase [Naematelia encephala]|uniref:Protein arginine methyltransferase NDUFAF7 n=1 Tax=Naematelia encephala TaxID=71784 RepID=A0A1Y2AQ78_9TREE|nr:S-adenosyl-L-methionine-dependent methyltransferase [Naematelia encephala]
MSIFSSIKMLKSSTRARWLGDNLINHSKSPKAYPRYFSTVRRSSTSSRAESSKSNSDGGAGNELAKIIRDSIKATGPISVSKYIQFALSHPQYGYYTKGDVFGSRGDFITSPEISQVFGELVAIWFLTRYIAEARGKKCRIVELGPGRGTLMEDMLRTFSSFPDINSSIAAIHLVENSEKMRGLQLAKLGKRCEVAGISLEWSNDIHDVPTDFDGYTFVIAHEFFDAMPINIYRKTQEGWREVKVDLEPSLSMVPSSSTPVLRPSAPSSGLRLSLSREATLTSNALTKTSPRFTSLPDGSQIELSYDSWKIARRIGQLCAVNEEAENRCGGGSALVVDYGGDRAYANSFRAFRNHKLVPIFDLPGSSDLTANVDFAYLKESLIGLDARALGPISQMSFLGSLGLETRTKRLLDAATPERRDDIRKAVDRLINPLGMGTQYQVMAITGAKEGLEVYPFVVGLEGVEQSSERSTVQ